MGLELNIGQRQTISQNMIQQMQILRMSSQELEEYLKEVSLENPVVELEETSIRDRDQERLKKLEWLDQFDEQNRIYYSQEKEDSDANDIMNIGGQEEESLEDSIKAQLLGQPFSRQQMRIFEYLIKCLDSRGFFVDSIRETASFLGEKEKKVTECLEILKQRSQRMPAHPTVKAGEGGRESFCGKTNRGTVSGAVGEKPTAGNCKEHGAAS